MGDAVICGPIHAGRTVVQRFKAERDHLSGVAVRLATYDERSVGPVRVRLARAASGWLDRVRRRSPQVLLDEVVPAEELVDNDYAYFYCPTQHDARGETFVLTITSEAAPHEAVTAWLVDDERRMPGHLDLAAPDAAPGFGLQALLLTSDPDAATAFPRGLLYSPLSSCNMNCTHCISRHSRARAVRLDERVKHEIRRHAEDGRLEWIFTDYSGDILFADRKSPGQLQFVLDLGRAVHIDTNGAYLDAATIERLLASTVDAVSVSIDAASEATYRTIRIGAPPLESIFASVGALVAARARHGRQGDFTIGVGFTLMRSNIEELPQFVERAAALGIDSIGCRHLEVYHDAMEAESLFGHRALFNEVRGRAIAVARVAGIELHIGEALRETPVAASLHPCPAPWDAAVVLANGDVMACCVPGSKMGNLADRTIEEIWQGEAYRRLRARVNSSDAPTLCRTCPYRTRLGSFRSVEAVSAARRAPPLLEELAAG